MRTENEVWDLCLKMWKDISNTYKINKYINIIKYKDKWLKENGFKPIKHSCFFCWYAARKSHRDVWVDDPISCKHCPGKKVDKDFCCIKYYGGKYDFVDNPVGFYNYLKELNKKRLKEV